jgi:peptidoglycan-N-acetylglucosamine deacetylase
VQAFFPKRKWHFSQDEKTLYLTFDDGPTGELTDWVVGMLARYNAKATFFCVGSNIIRHHGLLEKMITSGHSVGNHTFSHLNASHVSKLAYVEDLKKCGALLKSNLFRPPYGRLPFSFAREISRFGYNIVMWDVLTYDFDATKNSEELWQRMKRNIRPGSVIVLHDNVKAEKHLKYLLPCCLEHFSALGYQFEKITC